MTGRAPSRASASPSADAVRGYLTLAGLMVCMAALLVVASSPVLGQPGAPEVAPLQVRFIPAPDGYFVGQPAWLPGGERIVVAFIPRGARTVGDLWLDRVDLATSTVTRLALPKDPSCAVESSDFPAPLPDGRLAYLDQCWLNTDGTARDPAQTSRVMAYEPATGKVAPLLPYDLTVHARLFSFAPDMRVGIYDDGDGLFEHLRWLYPDRSAVLDLPLARVGIPAWSPDGRTIAVEGAPPASGYSGVERLDLPAKLYLLSVDSLHLQPILDGLKLEGGVAWSPDGHWLVGQLTFAHQASAIWLVEAATGRRYRVAVAGDVELPAWSPDGRAIGATVGANGSFGGKATGLAGLDVITLPDLRPFATTAGN